MLSGRGRAVAVATLVLLVVGRILGITELFAIAVVAAVLVVAAIFQVRAGAHRVAISAGVAPEAIVAGEEAVLELSCENTGTSPTPANRLQLVPSRNAHHRVLVPRLAPGERATVAVALDTEARGRHTVRGYDAVIADALGLAFRRLTSGRDVDYLVRPRSEELPQTLPLGAGGAGIESTRSAAERLRSGASFLRAYVEGDDLRRVHWRTTARVGDIMVREGGEPDLAGRSGTTVALVNHAASSPAFERAVEVAASVVRTASSKGPFRLLTTGGFDSGMAAGTAHLESVMVELSTVTPSALPPIGAASSQRTAAELYGLWDVLVGGPSSPDDWGICVVIEVLRDAARLERSRDELASLGRHRGPLVCLFVGGSEASFERLDRDRVLVTIPPGQRLEEIWTAPIEVSAGESRLVSSA